MNNPSGHRIEMRYDGLGRVQSVTQWRRVNGSSVDVATTSYRSYDVFGNLIAETDGNGKTKQSQFGGFAQLRRAIDEDGRVTSYTYDDFGRETSQTSVSGKNIRRAYDEAGHLVEILDLATGVRTTYGYDIMGHPALIEVMAHR
ncbi:hypothetical protein [Pseudoduganella sp. R-34]|uniref:hypothetical protein n=1 Tax=Pseudoduganella sp. R-34 TaxID=3404062 RepID=UPI003CFB5F4A